MKKSRKPIPNLKGRVFGRLLVNRLWARTSQHGPLWLCVCKCGSWAIVRASNLLEGKSRSCGCLRVATLETRINEERARQRRVNAKVHARLGLHDFVDYSDL
ncbi:MAG: hypothetical protein EOM37_14875 [Proteobacteria bacterium]|nr:hypothetical protein [Pseudomonadota bacterium]